MDDSESPKTYILLFSHTSQVSTFAYGKMVRKKQGSAHVKQETPSSNQLLPVISFFVDVLM